MVTAGTYLKKSIFDGDDRLNYLEEALIEALSERGWEIHAWAVFPNHYHFVGISPDTGLGLTELTSHLHRKTAMEANRIDECPGRRVWYRSWDTQLTFQRSYIARLAYVHENAVKHGLVRNAEDYPWCSARWFARTSPKAFVDTVMSMKTDKIKVVDDF